MNFSDKLDLLLEVFDTAFEPSAMTGVTVAVDGPETIYSFMDANSDNPLTYSVIIKKIPFERYAWESDRPHIEIVKSIMFRDVPGVLTDSIYNVDLATSAKNPFGLTKLGNQNFVYGKMLACVNDYMTKHGIPAILRIVPAHRDMTLVYDRLLRFINKVKGLKYDRIYPHFFVLHQVLEMVNVESEYLRGEDDRRRRDLDSIRRSKSSRRSKVGDPSEQDFF